jgi:DNA-directed RNA polymerase specialized sigma24 family protein
MGQAEGDRDEPTRSTSEPFEAFYLREYPQVVGLLHGLLGSRLVAEELAQETFLVAYREWDRISGLDNPRAWVRKVAVNQRGSFLRASLRQQTRERDPPFGTRTTASSSPMTMRRSGGRSGRCRRCRRR